MYINQNRPIKINNISFKKLDVQVESYQNWNPMVLNTLVKSNGIRTLASELAKDKKDLNAMYSEFKSPLDGKRNYSIMLSANKFEPYRFVEPSIMRLCAKVEQFDALNFYSNVGSSKKTRLSEHNKAKLIESESNKILKEFNKSLKIMSTGDSFKAKIKNIFD